MRHTTATSLSTIFSGFELITETRPQLEFQWSFPSSLVNERSLPGRRSLLANAMLCLLSLVVGCLSPLLLDLSRTARVMTTADKAPFTTRVLPYDPLELLSALALFNVILGLLVMACQRDYEGLSDRLRSQALHLTMLPTSLAKSLADVATLLSVSSGGGPLFVAVANTRLIMVSVLSRLLQGRCQTKTQWALLAVVTVAALKYGLETALTNPHRVDSAAWGSFWAVVQAAFSALGSVCAENRFKELKLWHARTVEQIQSLVVMLLVMGFKWRIVEPTPLCGTSTAEQCVDRKGWDLWTVTVLATMIGNGWLSLLLVKRISAVVEIVCKTAILPTLYTAYCLFVPGFHFELSLFSCVMVIGAGILFYGLDRHMRQRPGGPVEKKGGAAAGEQAEAACESDGGLCVRSASGAESKMCRSGTASTSCTEVESLEELDADVTLGMDMGDTQSVVGSASDIHC